MTTGFTNDYANGYVSADGFVGALTNGNPNAPVYAPALLPNGLFNETGTVTATAGGGQTNAVLLTAQYTNVNVVATANDSVKLPPATVGSFQVITNSTSNSCQMFGSGTDTLNGVATGTGQALAAGKTAMLSCYVAGNWVGPIALA